LRYRSDAHLAFRRPQDIARKSCDAYWIKREIGGDVRYDLSGREVVTRPDDLTVTDCDHPLRARARDGATVDFDVWVIPRAMLEPHLPARGGPFSLTLRSVSGLKTLATSYLDSLGQRLDTLSHAEAGQAADILCRLLGIACGAALPEQRDAVRAARLEQIKRHVDLHLTETDLSPAMVAQALGISVRSLHLAFEPTGTSFAQHVMRRRLQECRAALERPAATRSIIDVAFAWGFANLTTFYRAFRREFGMAPGEVRAACA
jgi:AraC-like DNA-binding protein